MWRVAFVSGTLLFFAAVPSWAAGAAALPTPGTAYSLAVRDAAALGVEARHVRYLWLGQLPGKRLEGWSGVLSYQANSLSREPEVVVPPSLAGGLLLRIDLEAYGIDPETWDKLAESDPYFHVQLEAEDGEEEVTEKRPYGHYEGDKFVVTEYRDEKVKKKVRKKVAALASWGEGVGRRGVIGARRYGEVYVVADSLAEERAVAELAELTHSRAPVLYGPWFFWQTAAAQDRNPSYYDFLGIKDQKSFEDLIGFDRKVLEKFPDELAEAVANSSVTARRKPRAIVAYVKVKGHYWRTLDVNVPKDDANPLRTSDPERFLDFAAQETIGTLPNGLNAWGLFNDKGVRQDVGPQALVFDSTGAAQNDFSIHGGSYSCMHCHTEAGYNDIRGYYREVLNRPPLFLASLYRGKSREEVKRLRRLYVSSLEDALEDDRRIVARALWRCRPGWEPAAFARNLGECWTEYNAARTLDTASAELGCTPEALVQALDRVGRSSGALDPVLATFLQPGKVDAARDTLEALKAGEPVQLEVWHEAYFLAQLALRGAVPAAKEK